MNERGATLGRAGLVVGGAALLEAGLLAGLAHGLEVPLAWSNGALLLASTGLLGAAWALRRDAEARSSSLAAALVPVIATAFFVVPRLWVGPAAPALLTLATSCAGAPLVERAWSRWVARGPEDSGPHRATLAAAAPVLALTAAAGAVAGWGPVAVGLSASAVAATVGLWRAWKAQEEHQRYAAYLDRVEVEHDRLIPPPPPVTRDALTQDAERGLTQRGTALAAAAAEDELARDAIDEARSLRTRFMAVMSHELRSPLNSIVGFTQVLEGGLDGELTEGQRESVAMIHRAADELISLLTDVLDLAALEAGRIRLHRGWIPSVEILTEAVRRARSIVEGRHVEIESELQPGLPPVHVDARRVQQAVVALFRNAASSLTRTTIRLRARVAAGPPGPVRQLRVEIHDAIGAIPTREVERIFEAFQEITAPTGRRLGGLGMALTLSRGLVRLHGGEVWAETVAGEGTVLCVALRLDEGGDGDAEAEPNEVESGLRAERRAVRERGSEDRDAGE